MTLSPSRTPSPAATAANTMVTVIHVTLSEAAAALAATSAAADSIIKSDTDIADLQTQLTDRPCPKPDVVSSALFHTDTDDDYDDAGDEGRDEDSKSSSSKPLVKVKEEDLEVEEGKTCCAVDHSSCTDGIQHPSISIDNIDNDKGEKRRDLQPNHSSSSKQIKKRQKIDAFTLDLSDVPPQIPISKHADKVKEGASKYAGVYKETKKWVAKIRIEGKQRTIGYYVDEEEAAADYARAVFKYRGSEALAKARVQKQNSSGSDFIDLSDVPPQSPILKSTGRIKEGASKYAGSCFNKAMNKWQAQIWIDGKCRHIGLYENEVEAAADFARAVFKYRGPLALVKARLQNSSGLAIDLSDVPPQPPTVKVGHQIIEGASKYVGVCFSKAMRKWKASIRVKGKGRHIGYYENEEEAAIDYARAVFKYRG